MSSMNSDDGMPFPPLPDSTSDDHLHTLQSSQFPPGSENGVVDPSFQIEAIAAFLDVLESDVPQDFAILDETEANDQSEHLISSSSTNQQEAQSLVATTTTQHDSSCSFNNFESLAEVPMDTTETLPSEVSSGINAPDQPVAARKFREKKCSANVVRSDDNELIFRNKVSVHRGVTRHKVSKRYEAHLWDSSVRIEGKPRKGRLVYLGGYNCEDDAARAYDLAALKYYGTSAPLNFQLQNYEKELEVMKNMTKVDFVASIRRKSSCFSRGTSVYRGVSRHRQTGKWQARIAKIGGHREDIFLGVFSTEEEAAEAYDIAAIKFRGVQTVTNFGVSQYDISYIVERVKIPITDVSAAKRVKESQVLKSTGNEDETIAPDPTDLHGSSLMPTFEQPQPGNVSAAKRVKESQVLEATGNEDETIAPDPIDLHGSSLMPTFEQPQPSPALQSQENLQVFDQNLTDNENQFPYLFQESYQFNQNFTDTQNQCPDSNFRLLTSSQEPTQFNQNFTDTGTQLPDHNPSHLNSIQEFNQLKVADTEMQLPDPIPSLLDFNEESDRFYLNSFDLQTWFPDTTCSPLNTSQESDQLNYNVTDNQTQLPAPTPSLVNVCQEASHFNQNSVDVPNWSPDTDPLKQNVTDSQSHFPQPTPFIQVPDQFNQDSVHVENWWPDTPSSLLNSTQESELNQSYFLDDMMETGQLSPPTMENNGNSGSNHNEVYLNNGLRVDANSSLQMNSPAMESQSDLGLVTSDYNPFVDSFQEDSSLPLSPLWNDVTTI